MIKIHPNPKYASYAQCNRCGRKVFSTSHDEEEIKEERRKHGWTFIGWMCYCKECTEQMEKDNE